MQTAGVDASYAPRDHSDAVRDAKDVRIEHLARFARVLLGVVERAQEPLLGQAQGLVIEKDRGGDERSCERTPPSLVGAGEQAHRELAIEREEPPAALATPQASLAPRASPRG